jgi:hypothetical protein
MDRESPAAWYGSVSTPTGAGRFKDFVRERMKAQMRQAPAGDRSPDEGFYAVPTRGGWASRRSSGHARLSIGPNRVDDEMSCCLLHPLLAAAIAAGMDRLAFWWPVRPLLIKLYERKE